MDIRAEYSRWLERAVDDSDLIEELRGLDPDGGEVSDRFYRDLAFGTGGLRGVLGAGTNRMNIYTVRRATQGLCAWLKASGGTPSVAIAHDSRIKSDLFAREAARVLAANGVTAWIYPRLEPAPALSWAVRYFHCGAGICVTASHNPAKYNGYKVYGPDGGQITLVAAVFALAAALLIIAPSARRLSSAIKHLSGDMALIAGGDLSHEVKLKGKTELAELAQSFDQMRLAIAARMERESEAVRANQELIGALSHDLRTPLTKQSSYLELALSERYKSDAAGMRACVEKASKATGELRERIEELFSYFLVFSGEKGTEPLLEDVDGSQVLARLLCEQAEFLRLRGFSVDSQTVPQGLRLRVYLPGLTPISCRRPAMRVMPSPWRYQEKIWRTMAASVGSTARVYPFSPAILILRYPYEGQEAI